MRPAELPTLRTARLMLRPWRAEDRAPFAELNRDPAVMEFLPGLLDRAASDELADRIERHFDEHGFGLWAVEVSGGTHFIGFVGLSVPGYETHFTPCVEIGWRLARSAWGHGYASEAARACLRFGFGELELPEIVSFTVPSNQRSRGVMERIGMSRDLAGDFEHPRLPPGNPLRSHVLYRLRREAWLGTR